ncbi:MAG TPA: hypothetical protein VFK74_09135 [Azospira sp.]|nr:hypothetical protein [Azospira sp.]
MRLTLLVPELLWPEPEDDLAWQALDFPALAALLHKGEQQRRPALAPEAQAARWLGLATPPLAALRLLGEEGTGTLDPHQGRWLCADPIHLRLHQEEIIVGDSRELDLTAAEVDALAASLNAHYAGEASFHPVTPRRWYLRLETPWAADLPWDALPPLSAAAGRRLNLPTPADLPSRRLLALMNEIQMLLHSHPVNEARAEGGQPAINGLWLWGAGALGDHGVAAEAGAIWSNEPLPRGLALAAHLQPHPQPGSAAAVLQAGRAGERHLVCLNDLLQPAQDQDAAAWRRALADLESGWFAPLKTALAKGRLDALQFVAGTSYGDLTWQLTPAGLKGGIFAFLAAKPESLQQLARRLAAA